MALTSRTRITRAVLPSLAMAAVMGGLLTAPATAAVTDNPVTATFVENGPGLNRVVPDSEGDHRSAGSVLLKLTDGTKLEAFCIEFEELVEKSPQAPYSQVAWAKSGKTSDILARATFIAEKHQSLGKAYTDPAWETAAAQVAIWELTDPALVDATDLGNKDFAARVDALVAASKSTSATESAEPVVDYKLDGAKSVKGHGATSVEVISGKLTATDGAPVADQPVTFVVDGEEKVVKTNAAGVASIELPRSPSKRTVAMRFETDVEAGTVFKPAQGQAMISADPFTIERQASLTVAEYVPPVAVDPTPAPVPQPKPAPEPAPTPQPAPEPKEAPKPVAEVPDELPDTGAGLLGLLGAGALVAGGVAGRRHFRRQ